MKSERTTIHRNLCICLLLAQIFILPDAPKFTVGCGFIAGFLHYFLLATFAWMLVEGIHVYLMLVKVFETGIGKYLINISQRGRKLKTKSREKQLVKSNK